MSKKVKQTLTGAMAAMMATGVVATPAMAATTDLDALYKAAYTATQKALTEKTQASVNEARKAIKALPAKLNWAIGEFSKKVDSVQHPILVNILNAIKLAEKTPTQANIDAARKAIPADLVATFKNSYSAAVDKVQQAVQAKVVAAVKLAETSKKVEDVEAAKKLIADVATAESQALKTWAKAMLTKVEAIKIYDLKVTKVTEVTRYTATIEFEALKETLKDVTIEVVDSKGQVHEVYAKNLLKGAKTTKFDFRTVAGVTELKGVWTVNGVEYDFTEIGLVKNVTSNIVGSTVTSNHTKLGEALVALQEGGYISGLSGKYDSKKVFVFDVYGTGNDQIEVLDRYNDALNTKGTNKINNAADIQAVIDKVNSDLEGNVSVDNLIALAEDTKTTAKQIYNAMVELGLEKVNVDWITEYRPLIAKLSTGAKLEAVQKIVYDENKGEIDKVNNTIVADMNPTAIKNMKVAIQDEIELVEAYYKDDADKETAKAKLLKSLNVDLALLDVKAVTDETDLAQVLMNLSDVVNDTKKFDYKKDINENILGEYIKGANDIRKAVSVDGETTGLKALAGKVQVSVLGDKVEEIKTAAKGTDADALLKALKDEVAGLKNILDANKDEYLADKAEFTDASATNIQSKINAINARVAINDATTVDATLTALNSYFYVTDKASYDKSEEVKRDIAEELLANRNETKKDYATIVELGRNTTTGAIKVAVDTIDAKLTALNGKLTVVNNEVTYTDRAQLIDELVKVTGKSKSELDSLVSKFLANSTVKKYDGTIEAANYKTYTQVRKALGL